MRLHWYCSLSVRYFSIHMDLGTGVPWTTHATMGLFFIALNLGVLIFIVASPPKYSGLPLVAAVLIVPIEIAAIFLIAFAEEAIKSWLK